MQKVYERCCGIDVHKQMIAVCFKKGKHSEIRQFGTFTKDLREMTAWLKEHGCQMVAMESTGPYWKPLFNVFELEELPAIVVNAAHMKALPGRKTDVSDAEWIADLLQHGLLKASFVPCRKQRELRELTRYRKSRMEERAREINRLQKMLEGANIKLSGTVTDITGQTAQKLLKLVTCGKHITVEDVSACMTGNLKSSAEELYISLEGIVTDLQRELILEVMRVIDEQTQQIARAEALVQKYMDEEFSRAASAIDELPGIAKISAQQIIAEIGTDMSRFPSADHLCSWAGICPGNNESAGKRRSGKTNKGNKILKSTITQCAMVAVKNKDTFFYAQYQRLVVRRGKKKAIIAVAHSMLIAIYHVLQGHPYKDLGSGYYNQFNTEKKIYSYLNKLKNLGWEPPSPVVSC
ncbi:MAG: IS110 family transposase [Firmicutes bacterium]|nr:IS110 family transposase [Bacillota bacterium]